MDNHSHILLAGIMEMVSSANAKSVSEFSITEHVSQFREVRDDARFGSVHSTGRIFESLKEYYDEFKLVEGKFSNLKVKRGLEVDFSPRYEAKVGNFVNQEEWDILLCSVHELKDGSDVERRIENTTDPALTRNRWRDYLKLEQMALESDFVPFNVLAHPVRMAKAVEAVPGELDELLLELAKTARRRNKALELNGNDISYAPLIVRSLARACSEAGCKVSLGSDAHRPADVFRNMDIAMKLADTFKLESL